MADSKTETKARLYQYAAILHPTEDEAKAGKGAELIVPVTTVLAPNDGAAQVMAARAIPEQHLDKLARVEVALRPF